ncbi:MAG: hypothetical protein AVDCRST_MAG30-3124, partial [uncultured Solirubrobacteraceae bacterium]
VTPSPDHPVRPRRAPRDARRDRRGRAGGDAQRRHARGAGGRRDDPEGQVAHLHRAGARRREGLRARLPLEGQAPRRAHLRGRVGRPGRPRRRRPLPLQAPLPRLPRLLAQPAGPLLLAGAPHPLREPPHEGLPPGGPGLRAGRRAV